MLYGSGYESKSTNILCCSIVSFVQYHFQGFLCEEEKEWGCPDGYILFQKDCYKVMYKSVTASKAMLMCEGENSKVKSNLAE